MSKSEKVGSEATKNQSGTTMSTVEELELEKKTGEKMNLVKKFQDLVEGVAGYLMVTIFHLILILLASVVLGGAVFLIIVPFAVVAFWFFPELKMALERIPSDPGLQSIVFMVIMGFFQLVVACSLITAAVSIYRMWKKTGVYERE